MHTRKRCADRKYFEITFRRILSSVDIEKSIEVEMQYYLFQLFQPLLTSPIGQWINYETLLMIKLNNSK